LKNRLEMSIKIKRFVKSGAPRRNPWYPEGKFLVWQRRFIGYV